MSISISKLWTNFINYCLKMAISGLVFVQLCYFLSLAEPYNYVICYTLNLPPDRWFQFLFPISFFCFIIIKKLQYWWKYINSLLYRLNPRDYKSKSPLFPSQSHKDQGPCGDWFIGSFTMLMIQHWGRALDLKFQFSSHLSWLWRQVSQIRAAATSLT